MYVCAAENYKLLLLFTDGVAGDWIEVLQAMRKMEETDPNGPTRFLIFGLTDNRRRYYDGCNFPLRDTLKGLGGAHADRLVMLSREEMRGSEMEPKQCLLGNYT